MRRQEEEKGEKGERKRGREKISVMRDADENASSYLTNTFNSKS